MGSRGYNAGGFAYMPIVQCTECGMKFRIGNRNPRRRCLNERKCAVRKARKIAEGVRL